jgi:hypothetical protein
VIAIALLCLSWFCCWIWTARMLYARWRPGRVRLCGLPAHQHESRQGGCYYSNSCGLAQHYHNAQCFRRWRNDLSRTPFDRDRDAAWAALAAAFIFPVAIGMLAFMAKPPELPEEKLARLAQLEREAARLEREAGIR